MDYDISSIALDLISGKPLLGVAGTVLMGVLVWKSLDKIILSFIIKRFRPEFLIKKFIKVISKQIHALETLVEHFDNKILDKNKKKFPNSVKKIEDELVLGIVVLEEEVTRTLLRLKQIIRE
jgi:hypothetical protein